VLEGRLVHAGEIELPSDAAGQCSPQPLSRDHKPLAPTLHPCAAGLSQAPVLARRLSRVQHLSVSEPHRSLALLGEVACLGCEALAAVRCYPTGDRGLRACAFHLRSITLGAVILGVTAANLRPKEACFQGFELAPLDPLLTTPPRGAPCV
jgi:hypothetical protein